MIIIGDVIARLEDVYYISRLIERDCSTKLFIHFKNGEVTSTRILDSELEKLMEELKRSFKCL